MEESRADNREPCDDPSDHTNVLGGLSHELSLPSLVTCTLVSSQQVAADEVKSRGPTPRTPKPHSPQASPPQSWDEPKQAWPLVASW